MSKSKDRRSKDRRSKDNRSKDIEAIRKKAQENLHFYLQVIWKALNDQDDFELREHQRRICKYLEQVESHEEQNLVIETPPRTGKALKTDTPILTPSGFKPIADLEVGDFVYDPEGKPVEVKAKSSVWKNRPVYRVKTSDGFEVIADENHEWLTKKPYCKYRLWNTKDIAREKVSENRRFKIPIHKPIEHEEVDLPIDPYLLGCWLGDGSKDNYYITCKNPEVRDWFIQQHKQHGVDITNVKKEGYFLPSQGKSGLKGILKKLGLYRNKHIPEVYFRGSITQRQKLLQGLIDTDGYVSEKGDVEITQKLKGLSEDIQRLLITLGVKSKIIERRATLYGKDCGPVYRQHFYYQDAALLPRKMERCRNSVKRSDRYIEVEPAGYADTVCIEVDSKDHLFLAGKGLLVTHNSLLVSVAFPTWYLGRNPHHHVLAFSHSERLGQELTALSRKIMQSELYKFLFPGVSIDRDLTRPSKNTQREFSVQKSNSTSQGKYKFLTTNDGLHGYDADLIIVDDPIGSFEKAASSNHLNKLWTWFSSDVQSRRKITSKSGDDYKAVPLVLMHTRFSLDDLAGQAIEHYNFTRLRFPALCDDPNAFEEWREVGEPIIPPLKYWEDRRDNSDKKTWYSLYQQSPIPSEQEVIPVNSLGIYNLDSKYVRYDDGQQVSLHQTYNFASVDLALGNQNSDYTAVCVWASKGGKLFLLDTVVDRITFPQTLKLLQKLRTSYALRKVVIESNATMGSIDQFNRDGNYGPRLPIELIPSKGQKPERAAAVAPIISNQNVFIEPTMPNWEKHLNELRQFPYVQHDDFTDAFVLGVKYFAENLKAKPIRYSNKSNKKGLYEQATSMIFDQ